MNLEALLEEMKVQVNEGKASNASSLLKHRADQLMDYLDNMNSYIVDVQHVLDSFISLASGSKNEKEALNIIDKSIDAARAFQNKMSLIKMSANRYRVGK